MPFKVIVKEERNDALVIAGIMYIYIYIYIYICIVLVLINDNKPDPDRIREIKYVCYSLWSIYV